MYIQFEIDGYQYVPEQDFDFDHAPIYHNFITPEGETVTCDWSSYDCMTPLQARIWLLLGMPDRIGAGPLNDKALLVIATKKGLLVPQS